jgi:hypothetical protein
MDNEEEILGELADVYIATLKDFASGQDKDVSKDQIEQMRETYIADARAKRNFGKGREKGKGKGKGKSRGKGKGKGKGRRRWGPRKGPKRSQSRTRGYAENSAGKRLHDKKMPFKKEHLMFECKKCNHKTDAGEPVPPHKLGDIICPEVQAGRVLCHPRWVKFKDKYPNIKFYHPTGTRAKPAWKKFGNSSPGHSNSNAGRKGKGKGFTPHDKKSEKIIISDKKNPLKRGVNGRFLINVVQGEPNDSEWVDVDDDAALTAMLLTAGVDESTLVQADQVEQCLIAEQQAELQAEQEKLDARAKEIRERILAYKDQTKIKQEPHDELANATTAPSTQGSVTPKIQQTGSASSSSGQALPVPQKPPETLRPPDPERNVRNSSAASSSSCLPGPQVSPPPLPWSDFYEPIGDKAGTFRFAIPQIWQPVNVRKGCEKQ